MKSFPHPSHRSSGRKCIRVRSGLCTTAFVALAAWQAHAANYTYNTVAGGNWSTTTDWTPNGDPGNGDVAVLGDTTADRTVIYDAAAVANSTATAGSPIGRLNTLTFAETSGFNDELQIGAQLGINVSTAITLGGAAVTGGTVTLDLQGANSATGVPSAALTNSTLTVANNGVLLLGLTGGSNNETFLSGALVLSAGGALTTNNSVGATATAGSIEVETLGGTGTFNMTGGTLTLNQSGGGAVRLAVSKAFTATGGTIAFAGTNTGSNGLNQLYLGGTGNSIGANVAITSTGTGLTGNGAEINLNTTGNQTLTYASGGGVAGADIFDLHTRYNSATGTGVKNVAYNGVGTGYIGTLYLNSTTAGGTSSLQLGSNLTTDASRTVIMTKDSNASAGTLNLDLNGYTLDGTAVTNGLAYATGANGLNNTSAGTDSFSITSTANAAAGAGTGTLKATGFNFDAGTGTANLRVAVGPGVLLQATGNVANDFGSGAPTAGTSSATFDPTSTFLYTGTAATVTTGGNTLGILMVGNGTTASTLTVGGTGTLRTAGLVTVNTAGTLLVNGTGTNAAGMTINGTLGGTGTITGAVTVASGGRITGATAGTGGSPVAANVGMLSLTSNATINGTYFVDIATGAALANDKLELTNNNTLTLGTSSVLTVNGTLNGTTTYDIADYASGDISGTFGTTNLPANYAIQYNATQIDLVPLAGVPEPAAYAGCLLFVAGAGVRYLRRRRAEAGRPAVA